MVSIIYQVGMIAKKYSKTRLLVVDDMLVHREMLNRLLTKEKYSVTLAVNGSEALEIMKKEKFDLVLLDVEMPEINGFEVCNVMRGDSVLKEIPVIFITSYGQIENKISGFGIGAQDFITKPFNNRELLVRINTHLLLKHKSDVIKNMNFTLESKNKSITQSIEYSRYILQALLPSFKNLDKLIPEKFLFFKSREIIGGDFYWFKQFGPKLYIAATDCTGHGVPGALMSVLGISLLNEVVNDHFFYSPNEILNRLRQKVIKALTRKNEALYNNDGMDMAMCLIDFEI
ncbi:MAG: response regulator [Bacteroidetes bacterium]|nr:response regulator [Bacteroidota bacterium]